MRATTLLNRVLDLPGATVVGVSFPDSGEVLVDVGLRRRRLVCPECDYTTGSRYDTRSVFSTWRHLDIGQWKVRVRAQLRRLVCPDHGVHVEGVPFARHRSRFTREVDDVVAFLATKTDKTTITRFLRIDWDTVGRICQRVVADDLDPDRFDKLLSIGVDEVSWRKHHNYLTLVTDHQAKKIVWGAPGKDTKTMNTFFAELGQERAQELEAVSMDMGPAFAKSVRDNASQATLCIDPFHVVTLVTDALDKVRRATWQAMRAENPAAAKKFKGARWSLLKRPDNLTAEQSSTLRKLRNRGGELWRAYTLREAFRAIFAGDLSDTDVEELIDRWCTTASRSRLAPFIKVAKTIRKFRNGILAAIRLRINNGRAEGLNNVVRGIIRRAYGFHTPTAALALVMLTCGPIKIQLPHEKAHIRPG